MALASLLSGNFRSLITTETGFTHYDNGDLTLQYNAGSKDTVFVRGSYRGLPYNNFDGSFPNTGPLFENRQTSSGVISENHIFSAKLDNEARFGFTNMFLAYHPTLAGSSIVQGAGVQGIPTTAAYLAIPTISISSISTISNLADTLSHGKDFEWNDNLIWTAGRHILKFGVDQIFDTFNGFGISGQIYGNYTFNGTFTGSGYADFLLGLPQSTESRCASSYERSPWHIVRALCAVISTSSIGISGALTTVCVGSSRVPIAA